MSKYVFTKKAVQDLTKIWNYTSDNWSKHQADYYYKLLLNSCEELAKNPDLGKNCKDIAPNLLGFRTNRHIIFYRMMNKNHIEITRIIHERMGLKKHKQGS